VGFEKRQKHSFFFQIFITHKNVPAEQVLFSSYLEESYMVYDELTLVVNFSMVDGSSIELDATTRHY
jgi:hypothetical protein